MDATALLFTNHEPFRPDSKLFKAVDEARMSVTAILTYPIVDLAGDYIEPSGGRYERHKAFPWCGLEHYRLKKGTRDELVYPDDPDAGRPLISGWLRESLSDSDGYDPAKHYTVKTREFSIKGQKHLLPVGTIYYDRDNKLSNQVFAMVRQDALPAVSLELAAPSGYRPKVLKAQSPLEPHRPAWHYERWDMSGLVNCARPVNPGALVSKSIHDDALASILDRRKIVTDQGTTEELHPLILKSLTRYIPDAKPSKVVGGFTAEKAMPAPPQLDNQMGDTTPDEPSVYDDAHDDEMDNQQGTPTAQVAYDGAQMVMDVVTHLEERLQKSEHVSGRKEMMNLLEELRAFAEKSIGVGDKVTADVSRGDDATGNLDDVDEPDIEEDDTEPDEDDPEKRMKAHRAPHRKVYFKSIKRFTAAEIAAAPVVELPEPDPGPSPAELVETAKKAQLLKLLRIQKRELLTS